MPTGTEFIRHEFDEAIAIQQSIVEAQQALEQLHPLEEGKQQMKTLRRDSEKWLKQLQTLGKPFGATGEREEVAASFDALAKQTIQSASGGDPSEAYEAHAVVLNGLRKQQDSAASLIKIARSMGEKTMVTQATEMQKACRAAANEMTKTLSTLAVQIAKSETAAA
jgi:hypothetical protein